MEFRRRPFARKISHIVIYSTMPVKQLEGFCEVDQVDTAAPSALWSRYGAKGGITRIALFRYLEGKATATAIVLRRFTPLSAGVDLLKIGVTRPPQSFQYLNDGTIGHLLYSH